MIDLTIIVPTCDRPKLLATCLSQLAAQSLDGIRTEILVVDESETANNAPLVKRFPRVKHVRKNKEGRWGAFAKDIGIALAGGEYVCFCDDDNLYHPHAIATLYTAAVGADIGVTRVHHQRTTGEFVTIPGNWLGKFQFREVDTMCVCVRTAVAKRAKWSDHAEKGTDFAWLSKLETTGITVRFTPVVIGTHL